MAAIERRDKDKRIGDALALRAAQYDEKSFKKYLKALER